MSWKGETGMPSFSMKMRCSSVWAAPIRRAVYWLEALEGMDAIVVVVVDGAEWKWPASNCVRDLILLTVAGLVGRAGAGARW